MPFLNFVYRKDSFLLVHSITQWSDGVQKNTSLIHFRVSKLLVCINHNLHFLFFNQVSKLFFVFALLIKLRLGTIGYIWTMRMMWVIWDLRIKIPFVKIVRLYFFNLFLFIILLLFYPSFWQQLVQELFVF